MGETNIGWTHYSFNPWIGCSKVPRSRGCGHCYAADLAENRMGYNGKTPERPVLWGPDAPRRIASDSYWNQPLKWNRAALAAGVQKRVFCASMADIFEDHPDLPPWRERLWMLIRQTPALDWLLLTKRPENFERMLPGDWLRVEWPVNVWLGTSVEDQAHAEERIPRLLAIPAKVRFLSVEPLLGPVDLEEWLFDTAYSGVPGSDPEGVPRTKEPRIHWTIVGAESGANRRPMDLVWVRSIRDQCVAAKVAFFYKQGNSFYPGQERILDGRTWEEFP